MGKHMRRDGGMFKSTRVEKPQEISTSNDVDSLISMQAKLLTEKYTTACLDAKQLQEVLNVGKDSVYNLLSNSNLPVLSIGNRKLVSIVHVAKYIVTCNSQTGK